MANVNNNKFASLRNLSKEEGVYEQIRQAITSGTIEAGQRLICSQVGEQLGVSSMPVRNALMRLQAEGLVTRIPHREYVVTAFSSKDIKDLYDLRAVVDGFAGRLAAQNLTTEGLEELQSIVAQAEEMLAAGDIDALRAVNRGFHEAITKIAGNQQLTGILQILQQRSQNYTAAYYALPGVPEKTIQDHRKILNALGKGKADLVEAMLKRDMTKTGEILAKLVQKREQSQ